MVGVAQLVERWIVVPVAEGSNPSTHPKKSIISALRNRRMWLFCGYLEVPRAARLTRILDFVLLVAPFWF
jgi:hypothetical protein